MKQKRLFDQGGSILTFLIIGIVLVAGLVGVIYYVNQRGEQARIDNEIASIDNQSNQSEDQPTTTGGNEADNNEAIAASDDDFTGNQPVAGLPETGINLNVFNFIGIFAVAFSASEYISSKRRLESHL